MNEQKKLVFVKTELNRNRSKKKLFGIEEEIKSLETSANIC